MTGLVCAQQEMYRHMWEQFSDDALDRLVQTAADGYQYIGSINGVRAGRRLEGRGVCVGLLAGRGRAGRRQVALHPAAGALSCWHCCGTRRWQTQRSGGVLG